MKYPKGEVYYDSRSDQLTLVRDSWVDGWSVMVDFGKNYHSYIDKYKVDIVKLGYYEYIEQEHVHFMGEY